jgi:type IV pilus assembly protein PilM
MTVEAAIKSDLKDAVLWEAEQYFPFDFSEVALDFYQIGKFKDKKAEVILVGTKKSLIESYVECLQKADLEIAIVDLDYFALMHNFELNYPKKTETVILLDLGASSIKMVIVRKNIPVFTRDINMGGMRLTEKIAEKLQLSFSDAENLKLSSSSVPDQVNQLISEEIELIAKEIKRTLDFTKASGAENISDIQSILLTGGVSSMNRLPQVIEEQLQLPTQRMNSFANLLIDENQFNSKVLKDIAAYAGVPIGLALRMQEP